MAELPRLVILAPSHFCEKALWALHRCRVPVTVEAQANLLPPGAQELCTRFDSGVGPDTRHLVYAHALGTAEVARALRSGVPWWQAFLFRAGAWPVVRAVMRKGFHIEPGCADLALEHLRTEFSYVSSLLADGRRYLVGDAFSGADLTFTALALPVLPIPYGAAQTFATARQPPVLQAAVDELAATPAGLFAARIWAEERQQVVG